MPKIFGIIFTLAMLFFLTIGSGKYQANAVTVEIARKCEALTSKAYPPREPGNPAAGSAKGGGTAQRQYFNKCVASGGKVDDSPPK